MKSLTVVEFVLLYYTVLTFKTLDETIPVVLFIMPDKGGSNF